MITSTVRALIGGLIGAVVMFVVSMILWASPLARIADSSASEQQAANVQLALANNLPHTGHYTIPNPNSAGGAVLYGRGPVATVDYNVGGYSQSDPKVLIGGFIQYAAVSIMIAFTLFVVAGRVIDFESRARLVIGFSAAAAVLMSLSEPIWAHGDWRFAIYDLVANALMMIAAGLVIARWFLPEPTATGAVR